MLALPRPAAAGSPLQSLPVPAPAGVPGAAPAAVQGRAAGCCEEHPASAPRHSPPASRPHWQPERALHQAAPAANNYVLSKSMGYNWTIKISLSSWLPVPQLAARWGDRDLQPERLPPDPRSRRGTGDRAHGVTSITCCRAASGGDPCTPTQGPDLVPLPQEPGRSGLRDSPCKGTGGWRTSAGRMGR